MQFQFDSFHQILVYLTLGVLKLLLVSTVTGTQPSALATSLDYDDDDLPRSDRRTFGDEHFQVTEGLKRKPCRKNVKVKNGRRRIESDGLEMRFRCNPGFMILGATVSICRNGKWSEEPPVCVKSGCRSFVMPEGVLGMPLFNGAVFSFHCQNPGQIMRGSHMIVCNGERWNTTAPRCYDPPTTTTTTTESTTKLTSAKTTTAAMDHDSEKNEQDSDPQTTEATNNQTENFDSDSTTTDSMDLFQNPNWPSMNFTLQPIIDPDADEVTEKTTSTTTTPASTSTTSTLRTTTVLHHAVIWLNQTKKAEATTTIRSTTQNGTETSPTTPTTARTTRFSVSETTTVPSTTSAPSRVNSTTSTTRPNVSSEKPPTPKVLPTTISMTTTPAPPQVFTSKSEPLTPKPSDKQPEPRIKYTTPLPRMTYCLRKYKGQKLTECLQQGSVTGRPGIPRRRPVRPTQKTPGRGRGPIRRPQTTRKPGMKPDHGSVANQSAPSIPLGPDDEDEPEEPIRPLMTSTSTTIHTSTTTTSTTTTTTPKIEIISAVDWHRLEQDNVPPAKGTKFTIGSKTADVQMHHPKIATDFGAVVMILVAIAVVVVAVGVAGRKYWRKHWGIARRSRSDSDCGSFNLGFSRECEDEFVFKEFGSNNVNTRDM